eukprot:scaffold83153_cov45-Attheya_sp.AAC.1
MSSSDRLHRPTLSIGRRVVYYRTPQHGLVLVGSSAPPKGVAPRPPIMRFVREWSPNSDRRNVHRRGLPSCARVRSTSGVYRCVAYRSHFVRCVVRCAATAQYRSHR